MPMHTIPQNVTSYQDKIVGKFVGRQFIYLAVGGLTAFILISTGGSGSQVFRIFLAMGIVALAAAMAIGRVNDRGFDVWALSFLKSVLGPTEWTWQKQPIPPQVLLAPDQTVATPTASIQRSAAEKSMAARSFNADRKDAFKSFVSGSSKDLDEDEQQFLQQLNFSETLPSGSKVVLSPRTTPPPMLTPDNPKRSQTVATPTPWIPADTQTAKPLAALAQSTIRPTYTFNLDGRQQKVDMMHNQRANRSLSRQLLSGGVMPVPVRGELRLNLDPRFQQELMGLMGFAPEGAAARPLSAAPTQPGGTTSPSSQPLPSAAVSHTVDTTVQPNTPTSQVDTSMDIKMQAASDFQSAPGQARHKLQIEGGRSSAAATPIPLQPLSSPPVPSDIPADKLASDPGAMPSTDSDQVSDTTPAPVSPTPGEEPIMASSLNNPTETSAMASPSPSRSADLAQPTGAFDDLAKRAQEQLERERQDQPATTTNTVSQPADDPLLTQHYHEELTRLQQRTQDAASQTQHAQQQLDSLQQQAQTAPDKIKEDEVEQQRQLVDKLRQEEQRSAAFARELLEKMQQTGSNMATAAVTAPPTPAATAQPSSQTQQPLAISPDNLPTLTTQPNTVNGFVFGADGQFADGAVVVIKNESGEPKRALKSNKLGQFVVTTPLSNGRYVVEVDKKGLTIDPITIELKGKPVLPLVIQAKSA